MGNSGSNLDTKKTPTKDLQELALNLLTVDQDPVDQDPSTVDQATIKAKDVPRAIHSFRQHSDWALFEQTLAELCKRKQPIKGSAYLCQEYR